MKQTLWGDRLGTPIDAYAFVLTTFFLGVFLRLGYIDVLSNEISVVLEEICFGASSIALILQGKKLKKKGILGITEIAQTSFLMYVICFLLPRTGMWGILWFILVAFCLFNLIGGFLAFAYTTIQKWSFNGETTLSRTESVVAILTSILVAVFAGIQLLFA